jgi:DNA-directed RNA polymerase subunit M/transcription elongation factor TFIIS
MQKVKGKGLHICKKCGNVMITRVIKRDSNPNSNKLEKILQCVVCKYWVDLD